MTVPPPPSQELSTAAGGPATSRQAPLALPATSPPNASGAWTPLLHGALAGRAVETLEAIGQHLGESPAPESPGALDPSLFTGAAGVAVCLGYLARLQGTDEAAAREFARAVGAAAETPQAPCF